MEHVDISNEIVDEHNKLTIQISQMNKKENNLKNHNKMKEIQLEF